MRTRLLFMLQTIFFLFGLTMASLFITETKTWMVSMPVLLLFFFIFVIDLTRNGYKNK
jgi:hypothetical protein